MTKPNLELMQSESGWSVSDVECGCGLILVDNLPSKAEALACKKRLDEFATRLLRRAGANLLTQ